MLANENCPELIKNPSAVENDDKIGSDAVTLKEFLSKQREMELEAAAALPFKFDRCSAELGPLRQNLHICTNCPFIETKNCPMAFCYACAVTCHNFDPENLGILEAYTDTLSHAIEEIWARRNFICDCPGTGHCKLLKEIPDAFKAHVNSYHSRHNFSGRYCICDGKGWAAGDRTMYQCEICEDWFHDDCVAKNNETDVIPAEDSFTDFICRTCVAEHADFFAKIAPNPLIFAVPARSEFSNCPIFLVDGWRANLGEQAMQQNLTVAAGIEHLLKEEEEAVYEPEIDTEAKESLYDLGLKALEKSAPRDQAILGIKLIDNLKDRLKAHLETLVKDDPSYTITAQDIQSFFEAEEQGRPQRKRTRIN